jgi:hypothetical protein
MSPEELRELLYRHPFEPFRLLLTTGETIDIRHPEMAIVAWSYVAVALRPRNGIAENVPWISLIHIVKASPLRRGRTKGRKHTA